MLLYVLLLSLLYALGVVYRLGGMAYSDQNIERLSHGKEV